MSDTKSILLCADDFGFNAAVSEGILKLVHKGRLSAVSCMVNMPSFKVYAPQLVALKDKVHLGLHFNLTEGELLSDSSRSYFGLRELLIKTHLGLIDTTIVANEFRSQLQRFQQVVGCLPDFIDGHQHIHQFPGIRQAILNHYDDQLRNHGTYLRCTYPALSIDQFRFKAMILARTGGKALKHNLADLDIPHNSNFAGIYDLSPTTNYRALFRQWLQLVTSDTLIMCHPGEPSSEADEIAATRPVELAYFMSADFVRDLEDFGVQLTTGPKPRQQKAIHRNQPQYQD